VREPSVVYTALSTPMLLLGGEFRLVVFNAGFYLFMLILIKAWWWFPVTWLVHQFLKSITKNDPWLRKIYLVYMKQSNRYEPFPESAPKRGLRPIGCGRGAVA